MLGDSPREREFWTGLFDTMHQCPGDIDTWDHQWKYACWSQNGLATEPSVNLVANIGLGHPAASHTTGEHPMLRDLVKTQELGPLSHPPFVVRHGNADAYIFDTLVGVGKMGAKGSLLDALRGPLSMIKKMLFAR